MEANQINKELVFNEAMVKLDSMMNIVIEDFIDHRDQVSNSSPSAYIVVSGTEKNHIIYKNINTQAYQSCIPQSNCIAYINSKSNLYIFNGQEWRVLGYQDNNTIDYTRLSEYYTINENTSAREYLYLNGDTQIELNKISVPQLTLIIKQNHSTVFNVEWVGNILFPGNFRPSTKLEQDSLNIFTFYSLPQDKNCLMQFSINYQS